jgi:opacity protein-like surface antigen
MINRYLLSAAVTLVMASGWSFAQAKPLAIGDANAWYIGVEGGWTGLASSPSGSASSPLVGSLSEDLNGGYNLGARVGYQWGALRIEEEFRYQHNDITSITDGVPAKNFAASGTRTAYALMTNAIYDFDTGGPLTPHLGAGIGAVDQRDEWSVASGRCDDAWDWQFGYQLIAGLRYKITPTVAVDLDYRYFATTDPTFVFNGSGAPLPVRGTTFKSTYATNTVMVGLTVLLGGAAGNDQ